MMAIVDPAGFPGFSKNPLRLLNRSPSRGQRNAIKKAGLPAAGLVAGSPFAVLRPDPPFQPGGRKEGLEITVSDKFGKKTGRAVRVNYTSHPKQPAL
jgi:hypothetical protein